MPSEKIIFKGSQGDQLAAKLDKPEGEIKAYALFAHCFTCGKDLSAINRISRSLNRVGIALFRFDFTGLGMSKGEFANTNFSSNIEDLIAATEYMRAELSAPEIMFGHSLGGTAILVAATQIAEVKAVATIGSPANAINVIKQFGSSLAEIEQNGEAEVLLAKRPFKIKKQFVDDANSHNVLEQVRNLHKPLLIMHSPIDDTVPLDHARQIYEAAMHPKSFVSLDKADHLLMKESKYGEYAANLLATWSEQYIS